jgi:hypothetical protein
LWQAPACRAVIPLAGGGVTTRPAERVVASPGPSFTEAAGRGAYLPAFKSQTVWI